MELFLIYVVGWSKTEVKIEPIKIERETDKMYYVRHNCLSIQSIRKASPIPFFRNGQLITNDVEAGIKLWNERINKELEECHTHIKRLEAKIIKEK